MQDEQKAPLFLRAARAEPCERAPLWIMRQAGRYLSGYRETRAKHDFLTVCRTPELACEVTLQPIRRYRLDASIVFSDIMMPLESMGVSLAFAPGPMIAEPIRDAEGVRRLIRPEPGCVAPFVGEAIRLLRRELPVPLIGFAGAPWTLAAYLIEGRGSKDFAQARAMAHREPALLAALLDKLSDMTIGYLQMQIDHGAQAIQLFDSWAGLLGRQLYRELALPAVTKIMRAIGSQVPRIYFVNDAAHLLPLISELDAEVLGVDWRLPLDEVRQVVGPRWVLQGNMDPTALLGPQEHVRRCAREVLRQGGGARHIFNLGHGILPQTPEAHVDTLVAVARGEV